MTKPILCPVCGHSIDKHLPLTVGNDPGCQIVVDGETGVACDCGLLPSDITNMLLLYARTALYPFVHEDLSEVLGGNVQGDESAVFQRNNAILRIKHFRLAAKCFADLNVDDSDSAQ